LVVFAVFYAGSSPAPSPNQEKSGTIPLLFRGSQLDFLFIYFFRYQQLSADDI